jgi:predicted transglutaminase-like cysteine proteinase
MQGRSIMSVIGHIARVLFLAAVCSSGVFVDTHPSWLSSAAETHAAKQPDGQRMPESKSGNLALPQFGSLTPNLMDHGENAPLPREPHGGKTPDIQRLPRNESGALALPQLSSLTPNLMDPSKDALPSTEPFDLPAMTTSLGEMSAKWAELQSRILADEKTLAACGSVNSPCPKAARRFLSIVELGRKHQGRARLGWINRAVNLSISPMSDWAQYGYADFWASPLQTLSSAAGDCEDYAIVKYVALRHLGIAPDDLRLLIVRDDMRQAEHAIVAVRYEQKWLLLDNRTMAMINASQSRHYFPLFVLNYQGVRAFTAVATRR